MKIHWRVHTLIKFDYRIENDPLEIITVFILYTVCPKNFLSAEVKPSGPWATSLNRAVVPNKLNNKQIKEKTYMYKLTSYTTSKGVSVFTANSCGLKWIAF